MEFWYYQTGFSGGDERIVGTEYASSSRYGVDNQHGDWSSYLYDGTNASSLDYWNPTDNTPSIIQNTWHHFAVTYDGNNSRFFLNGIMLKEEIASLSGFGDPNQDLVINRHTWASGSSSRLSGQLDELRISNVARYTSDFTPPTYEFIPDQNTMGLWHFNQDFNDYSGNGNNGTHQGSDYSSNTPDFPPPMVTSVEITGTSGYRMLTSPVAGNIYSDLLEELWTQGAEGSDQPSSYPNIFTYDGEWIPVIDLDNESLSAGQGFAVYVFSDTDFDGDDDLPVTLSIDGIEADDYDSDISISASESSWNLVGNPYPWAVDISQLADDNSDFNSSVYVWDYEISAYRFHNGQTGNIADGLIAPFQGFWTNSNSGTEYTFTLGSISSNQGTNYRTTDDDTPGSAIFSFHVGDYTSSVYLSFDPDGHINLDNADALRLLPMEPASHLTSMIHEPGKSLSINNLPLELSSDISFPMDVMMLNPTDDGYETQAEQVNLTWDITNLPEGMSLALVNNGTGQTINLYGYPSANVNLPSKGGFSTPGDFMATYPVVGDAQFTLSVNSTLAGAKNDDILPEQLVLHNAYPNPFNPSTLIRFDLSDIEMVSLDIFDLAGKQVASLISEYMIPGSHQVVWNPSQLSSGVYFVKLIAGNTSLNQKITYIK